jgi:hypothetical protein
MSTPEHDFRDQLSATQKELTEKIQGNYKELRDKIDGNSHAIAELGGMVKAAKLIGIIATVIGIAASGLGIQKLLQDRSELEKALFDTKTAQHDSAIAEQTVMLDKLDAEFGKVESLGTRCASTRRRSCGSRRSPRRSRTFRPGSVKTAPPTITWRMRSTRISQTSARRS